MSDTTFERLGPSDQRAHLHPDWALDVIYVTSEYLSVREQLQAQGNSYALGHSGPTRPAIQIEGEDWRYCGPFVLRKVLCVSTQNERAAKELRSIAVGKGISGGPQRPGLDPLQLSDHANGSLSEFMYPLRVDSPSEIATDGDISIPLSLAASCLRIPNSSDSVGSNERPRGIMGFTPHCTHTIYRPRTGSLDQRIKPYYHVWETPRPDQARAIPFDRKLCHRPFECDTVLSLAEDGSETFVIDLKGDAWAKGSEEFRMLSLSRRIAADPSLCWSDLIQNTR